MVYLLLRALLRHALRVFFRRLDVEGLEQVPPSGPLLLAANHPNTLLDVLLVATYLDRRVGFVAKSTLFRGLGGVILRGLGAVPVYRREDAPIDEAARARNDAALAACEEAVAAGRAILIFPEGVSQEERRLQQLKTGLARIALGAEARAPGQVAVVPVALVYDDPETFRSRAHVRYGAPIRVAPFLAAGGADRFASARALTEAVRAALAAAMVHVERPSDDPLVRELDAVYGRELAGEAGGPLAATAAIARAVNAFAESEPARVERVRALLADYRAALAAAGVEDAAVRARAGEAPALASTLAWLGAAPVAAWGILNHLVLYHVPRLVLRLLPVHPVYSSTVKLLSGLLALGGCYAAQGALVHHALAPWAGLEASATWSATIAYLGTLPLSGLAALLWLERLEARRRRARVQAARRRLDPAELERLREARAALVSELDRARADSLAASAPPGGEPV